MFGSKKQITGSAALVEALHRFDPGYGWTGTDLMHHLSDERCQLPVRRVKETSVLEADERELRAWAAQFIKRKVEEAADLAWPLLRDPASADEEAPLVRTKGRIVRYLEERCPRAVDSLGDVGTRGCPIVTDEHGEWQVPTPDLRRWAREAATGALRSIAAGRDPQKRRDRPPCAQGELEVYAAVARELAAREVTS